MKLLLLSSLFHLQLITHELNSRCLPARLRMSGMEFEFHPCMGSQAE